MTAPSEPPDVDPLVDDIVAAAWRGRVAPSSIAGAAFLLVDFLTNAQRGGTLDALLCKPHLESVGMAAAAAHHADLDDVHWPTLSHPGSIVWPGVLAYGAAHHGGAEVMRAASIGYEVTAEVARLIAAAGIDRWHRTALAGHAGAAAAVAAVRGFDEQQGARAVALALTVAGGVGQTMVERSPASGFHRACAAHNGAAAVEFSGSGMSAPRGVLSGPSGLLAACGGSPVARSSVAVNRRPAIEESTIRVFPTNGFAQSAVAATVRARERFEGPVSDIVVDVNPAVAAQFRGRPANRHWDLLGAVRTAWSTGDPWTVDRHDISAPTSVLHEDDGLALGDAQVTLRGSARDQVTVRVDSDFSRPDVDVAYALEKWSRQGVVRPNEQCARLQEWLASDEVADPRIFNEAGAGDTDRPPRR